MDSPTPDPLATQKDPASSSEELKDSAPGCGLSDKDEYKPVATSRNPRPEEGFRAYRPGGLCPIELESVVHERYRILDKVGSTHRCTSWVARDQRCSLSLPLLKCIISNGLLDSSSELVQLDIFSAEFSGKATNSDHTKHFRNFIYSSASSYFQKFLDEIWIDSANGPHLCRALELGVLDVGE